MTLPTGKFSYFCLCYSSLLNDRIVLSAHVCTGTLTGCVYLREIEEFCRVSYKQYCKMYEKVSNYTCFE